ncbi:hypothetical protein MRX96_007976 [Rhipicephalus microplus]
MPALATRMLCQRNPNAVPLPARRLNASKILTERNAILACLWRHQALAQRARGGIEPGRRHCGRGHGV